jgi:TonB family protein
MNRLQKKCFLFSMAVHGLLAILLLVSAAFRSNPQKSDFQVMTLIPAQLLDRAGAGGGSPAMTFAPQPQAPPQSRPQPQTAPARTPDPIERSRPRQAQLTQVAPRHPPEEVELASNRQEPSPLPVKKHHQIKPDFTPVERSSAAAKSSQSRNAATSARSAETRRIQEIEQTFSGLASNVRTRAGQTTTVELAGAGGGEPFAGYETAIFNAYNHAWSAPEDLADRLASVDARIVVARDGSILSAEILTPSGHRELDRSVDQALRLVTKLPPFPESAQDPERTFLIRFNLEAKLSSG